MQALYLTNNKVGNIEPIGKMTKLASLYLGHNQIADLKPLANVKRISTLDLSNNKITDVAPLREMNNLHITQLQNNEIKDLAPIVEMAKKDADGEKRFAPYWELYLGGNPLSDAGKKQLEELKALGVRVKTEVPGKK
jgi:Leucine-rich repeat (LRR) protein